MEIKLTPEESEKFFHTDLCNGLGYTQGHGISLEYNQDDYRKAKESLKGSSACYEDVLMQVLRKGGKLTMVDDEATEDDLGFTKAISLDDVHKKVQLTPARWLIEMDEENDDADTADAILQTVFFDKIIFG